jgi:hypothetical protein
VFRPGEFDLEITGIGAKSVDPVKIQSIEVETHVEELMDRPGSQPIATGLLAGIPLLFYKMNFEPIAGEPVCG